MKSYQVWQHRRLVVSALGEVGRELEFVRENLARDGKNYHTWGYRQWVLSHFGGLSLPINTSTSLTGGKGAGKYPELWKGEEQYVDMLLQQDVRNNSAWNHRWFINFSRFGLTGNPSDSLKLSEEVKEALKKKVKYEKAYAKASLSNVPNNASGWNYLRALHTSLPSDLQTPLRESVAWAKTLVSTNVEAEKDPSVDIMGRGSVGALEWWLDCAETIDEAEALVKRLIVADIVRKRFWAYKLKTIRRSLTTS